MSDGNEPRSAYYESQRLRMHYVVWGEGSGAPPMLMIHGGQDHCRNWDFVARRLAGRFTIYAPDLRGHGDSAWSIGGMYSFPEFVLDVATLASTLPQPITVIGHSLGGGIALQYAGVFPERIAKVVSIEGWGPPDMTAPPAPQRMRGWIDHMHEMEGRHPRRYQSLDDATRRMQEANPHLTAGMARHLTLHGTILNADGTYSWKFDNYVRVRSPYSFNMEDAVAIWSQISAPALLIKGAESWAADPERSDRCRSIKDRTSVIIDNAGHWVHHDQLDEFMEAVDRFLAD
jgi:pimeloyl-ACP methyl ester carboxylesterase